VYTQMEWWTDIRRRVLVGGESKRQIIKETGIHWETLQKVLTHSEPPGYRLKFPRNKPKIGPYMDRIYQILEEDKGVNKKQRHTAKRIFERLRDEECYTGGYTQVKEAVRQARLHKQEVFMPLIHRPGEAQVDLGYALVNLNGQLRKLTIFMMALPYSDAFFMRMYERECTEIWWDGHVQAFEYFEGVPNRITFDNAKVLVAGIIGPHERKLTKGFLQLQSHYLFAHHFCRVRRANEKGVVEGTIKYARCNFLVPVPQVRSLEQLNQRLLEQCKNDLVRKLRGKSSSKQELLEEDRMAFLPLPSGKFDACRKRATMSNSLSLVRFDGNDYSVPVRWAHHSIVAKGYADRVEVAFQDQVIASHQRDWGKEGITFEPIHYLELLERKPGALNHARPLADWELPECFEILHRRQREVYERQADREYIRVLRLLEKHDLQSLTKAITKALRHGAVTRDAIAQYLIPQEDLRQTTFSLAGRDHLRLVKVGSTRVDSYKKLVGGAV